MRVAKPNESISYMLFFDIVDGIPVENGDSQEEENV